MNEELESFLKTSCPEAYHAWRRKINHPTPDTLIGRDVRTLRAGFGGNGGQRLRIDGIENGYLKMSNYQVDGVYSSPFELEERKRGIIDQLVPNMPTRSAWYLELEPLPDTLVVFLQGVPGSGKTTLAKELEGEGKSRIAKFFRITTDEVGPNQWKRELREALDRKEPYIVLDRCHTTKEERKTALDIVKPYKDRVISFLLTLPDSGFDEYQSRINKDVDHPVGVEKRSIALKCHMKNRNKDQFDAKGEGWGVHYEVPGNMDLGPMWKFIRDIR